MSTPLVVGVDVHYDTNTCAFMDAQGQPVARRRTVPNNRPGTEAFVHEVLQQVQTGAYDTIWIAAEATGWYWWHFF